MTMFVVTYPVTEGAKFDSDYYIATHMPLVREHFTQHGMKSAEALLPEGDGQPYAAVALLEFEDGASLDRAMGSAEAPAVFGDVANFTDIAPVAVRCERR